MLTKCGKQCIEGPRCNIASSASRYRCAKRQAMSVSRQMPAVLVGGRPNPLEHLLKQLSYAIENRYFLPRPFFGNMLLYEVEYFSISVVKN